MRQVTLLALLLLPALLWARVEKLRCMWRTDPATSMVIGWHQASGEQPLLHYATYDAGSDPTHYPHSAQPDRSVWAKGMNNQFVRLKDLVPNTLYFFIITDSEGSSQQLRFQTAPDNRFERLSIIAGGDSRNYRDARRHANQMVSKLQPHCVLFAGDMTGGDSGREWVEWMEDWQATITPEGRLIPVIAARGNHEASNQTLVDMFDIPNENAYFALTLGGDLLRVYTLNSMYSCRGKQLDWLEGDLQQHSHTRWRIAQYHHAIRSHTERKRERKDLQKYWAPLFYEHQVQLAIECDAHVVKNTYPVRPDRGAGSQEGFIRDDRRGTVYVGEGCWGAPLRRANDPKVWTRSMGSFNQFKWLWIDADGMEIRTVKTNSAPSTAALSDCDRFNIPSGIELWNPESGTVVRIPEMMLFASASEHIFPKEVNASPSAARGPNPVSAHPKTVGQQRVAKHSKPLATLPKEPNLEVTNFSAQASDGKVQLQWETRHEPEKSILFELLRSHDGKSYHRIATVESIGLSLNEYRIKDGLSKPVPPGQYQYRLVHQNHLGIQKVLETQTEVTYPIDLDEYKALPWDEKNKRTRIQYYLPQAGQVEIMVQDTQKRIVQETAYHHQRAGNFLRSMDLKTLPDGYYRVTIKIDGAINQHFRLHKRS